MTRQDALGGQLLTAVLTVDPRFFLTHFLAETANNMKKTNRKITEVQRQNALVPEGAFYGSWPCSWSFLRKKVQPSMCSSLVFFASEFFEYPSCRSVSLVPPFGIELKCSVTLVTSMDSWSHFHVKPSVFPLSNMVNLPRRCQSCLGQEK